MQNFLCVNLGEYVFWEKFNCAHQFLKGACDRLRTTDLSNYGVFNLCLRLSLSQFKIFLVIGMWEAHVIKVG